MDRLPRDLFTFRDLTHVVEWREDDSLTRVWEVMAAFNVDRAAHDYRDRCAKAHPDYSYRVRRIEGR